VLPISEWIDSMTWFNKECCAVLQVISKVEDSLFLQLTNGIKFN
jgi:hypothetical protein